MEQDGDAMKQEPTIQAAEGQKNSPVHLASDCVTAESRGAAYGVAGTSAKLCNYCGVVVDSGMVCTTDGEFNDCPNKQIGEAIGGVPGLDAAQLNVHTALRRLIADDAYAITFQTMGQYRAALLRAVDAAAAAAGVLGTPNDQQEDDRG